MYITNMFEKYKEWKLLRIFLQYPDRGFYTKEITRQTKIGAGTVNVFLHKIQKDNILIKDVIGNVHLYKLNNEIELVKQLKIFNTLLEFEQCKLVEQFLKLDDTIISIILYGSHANGDNDTKSDIDMLMIINKKKSYNILLKVLEKKLNKEICLQQMTIAEWQKIKEKDKIFYESILEKHIKIYGSGLP